MKNYTLNNLVNDYGKYIRTIINNSSKDLSEEDKEEILEDVIYNVYKKLDTIEEEYLKPYVAKATKNLVINKLKANDKLDTESLNKLNEETNFEVIDINSDIENIVVSNDKMTLIKNIINGFNEIDKNIFIDFYFSNKNINEISKTYKISKTNIKVKLHRARQTMKKELIKGGYNYD